MIGNGNPGKRVTVVLFAGTLLPAAQPSDPLYFSRTVYPILQKADCRGCHTDSGVASATRLHFPVEGAAGQQVEAFGKSLIPLINREAPASSLLVNKPTNRLPHAGGQRLAPGSSEAKVLIEWASYLARLKPNGPQVSKPSRGAPAPLVRRLTNSQYNHTVSDLLGDQTQPARQFPAEDTVGGFKTHAQTISPLLAESYLAAAAKLARNAFRFGDQRRLIPCRPVSPTDAGCAAQFVRQFGLKAFRRPLTAEEQSDYTRLLITEARAGEFLEGARIVVEAMLGSPNFLLRVERDAAGDTHYGMASMLSYALWDTMPDEELFRAAGAGELSHRAGVEKQARRMLRSPRSRDALNEFVSQWLRFDHLTASVKDRRTYEEFVPPLAEAMAEETRRLVHHLVWNGRNFMEFFSANYTFLNAELARLYNLPAPAEPFGMVEYPAGSERAGIFGHGLFLAQTGKPEETSPTERGLFVREHFLCQHVPPPPPGINSTLPPFLIGSRPMTNRERLTTLHLSNPSCAGCHSLIDPIGFGLERFDTIGRWHQKQQLTIFPTKDQRRNVKPEYHELELDTRASILGIPDSKFSTAAELGRILANEPTCQKCIVRNWFRFVMGRQETEDDRMILDRGFEDFRSSGFRFQEIMVSVLTSLTERSIQ
jgi:hypothetical protein